MMARSKQLLIPVTDEDEPNPYVICSRRVDDTGYPVNDRHILWEAAPTEEHALLYAEVRAKSGYWVEVYKNLYYYAPQAEGED